jgi:dolichol-phosphate mannosyltransferase
VVLSIVTPAFNEAANLEALYARIVGAMAGAGMEWEWLVVDDHSRDATFDVIARLAAADPRVRAVRLSRNFGSHIAITCGLHHARGDAAVVMAADLQDPPETIGQLLECWRGGAQIVWAVRRTRPGDRTHARFAALYYWVMRHVVGLRDMPARGADFFLVDRVVLDAFRRFPEGNVSVFALLTWMGFRQEQIEYDKQPRAAGVSGWTRARQIKLVVDSMTAFSDLPIRLCLGVGAVVIVVGLLLAIASIAFLPSLGAGLLLVLAVIVGLSGLQFVALGLVGQYVWRAFDAARRRPAYLVEATAGDAIPRPRPEPR